MVGSIILYKYINYPRCKGHCLQDEYSTFGKCLKLSPTITVVFPRNSLPFLIKPAVASKEENGHLKFEY